MSETKPIHQTFTDALNREKLSHLETRSRLETQVQERETDLLNALHKIEIMLQEMQKIEGEGKHLKQQVKGLEEQLAEEHAQRTQLSKLIQRLQENEHLLQSKLDISSRVKEDLQRRLDASTARIDLLEKELLLQKREGNREREIQDLRHEKILLDQIKDKSTDVWGTIFVGSTICGIAVGGVIGGPVGLLGACIAANYFTTGPNEKIEQRLSEIQVELDRLRDCDMKGLA